MKFSFGIRARIILIIIFLILGVFVSFRFMLKQIEERDELILDVTGNYQPSLNTLSKLQDKFEQANKVFIFWIIAEDENQQLFREEFNFLYSREISDISENLITMSDEWNEEDQRVILETLSLINDSLYFSLLSLQNNLEEQNLSINSSDEAEMLMAETGTIFLISEIDQNLSYLYDKRNAEVLTIFDEISLRTRNMRKLVIFIFVILGVYVSVSIVYLFTHMGKYIRGITGNLDKLASGNIPEDLKIQKNNEFSTVNTNLNKLFQYLRNLTEVARKIGNKDFSTDFKPLSNSDELGKAMVNLQDNLRQADIDEKKYKKEEQERSWTSDSIARINDILRSSTESIEDLGFELIQAIVKLTNSMVGGFFIVSDDDEPEIKLIASYAYDRRKYLEKSFKPGEGLIGRSVIENEQTYLTDIPETHLSIKSGMGQSKPVSLLITPIHMNEKVFGVIEIASFNMMEKYQLEFVRTIGENIATTISNLQTNIHTSHLLEHTKQQAEEMLSQEEEMRQNMEELRATQEEFAEREKDLLMEIEALKKEQRTDEKK